MGTESKAIGHLYLYGGQMANVKKSNTALITRAPVPSRYSNVNITHMSYHILIT